MGGIDGGIAVGADGAQRRRLLAELRGVRGLKFGVGGRRIIGEEAHAGIKVRAAFGADAHQRVLFQKKREPRDVLVEAEAGEGAVEIDVVGADQGDDDDVGLCRLDAGYHLFEFVRCAERHVFLADDLAAAFADIGLGLGVGLAWPDIIVADQIIGFGLALGGQPADRGPSLLVRRLAEAVDVSRAFAAFIDRRVDVGHLALDGRDQRLASGAVVRADEKVDFFLEHQADRGFRRLGGGAAGIGGKQSDLLAENAAGLVDFLGGKLGAGALRRPKQRGGTAQRDEEPDLELIRGGSRADQSGQSAECGPRRGGAQNVSAGEAGICIAHGLPS